MRAFMTRHPHVNAWVNLDWLPVQLEGTLAFNYTTKLEIMTCFSIKTNYRTITTLISPILMLLSVFPLVFIWCLHSLMCHCGCFNINGLTRSSKSKMFWRTAGHCSRAPPIRANKWRDPLRMSGRIMAQERPPLLHPTCGGPDKTRGLEPSLKLRLAVARCFLSSICAGQAQPHNVTRFMTHQCVVLVADTVHRQD